MNEDNIYPPPRLADNHTTNLPLVLAVDLGGTQIRSAILQGTTLLSRVGLLTGENSTPARVIPRMYSAVEQALSEAHLTLDQIAGIGIGAPGPLNSRSGVVCNPPNLRGWDNIPLREMFNQQFQVPIFLENDANVACLGEYMFGAGQGCHEMAYMTVSTGVGGGVITNGQLLLGVSGITAEFGHMTIDWHGERCNCGNIGCLETIASGTAISRYAHRAIQRGEGSELLDFAKKIAQSDAEGEMPSLDARTVALAAEEGIPLARSIITNAAEALGVGLVNIIHIFNPEMIVLGGGVMQIGAMLMEPIMRIVQERATSETRSAVRIVPAQLGGNVGLVGAGALVYQSIQASI